MALHSATEKEDDNHDTKARSDLQAGASVRGQDGCTEEKDDGKKKVVAQPVTKKVSARKAPKVATIAKALKGAEETAKQISDAKKKQMQAISKMMKTRAEMKSDVVRRMI